MASARETYDAMAADYIAHVETSPYTALYEAPGLRALLPPVAGRRVLDVGCGTGFREAWERLTRRPQFLFVRLVPA